MNDIDPSALPQRIAYSKKWRQHWDNSGKRRQLMIEWVRRWPLAFRLEDALLAHGQPRYHFNEWIAARYLSEKARPGCLVLIEKYFKAYGAHREKYALFQKHCPAKLLEVLKDIRDEKGGQAPDLMVIDPAAASPFFVETKCAGEPLTECQEVLFPALENAGANIQRLIIEEWDREPSAQWWNDSIASSDPR